MPARRSAMPNAGPAIPAPTIRIIVASFPFHDAILHRADLPYPCGGLTDLAISRRTQAQACALRGSEDAQAQACALHPGKTACGALLNLAVNGGACIDAPHVDWHDGRDECRVETEPRRPDVGACLAHPVDRT